MDWNDALTGATETRYSFNHDHVHTPWPVRGPEQLSRMAPGLQKAFDALRRNDGSFYRLNTFLAFIDELPKMSKLLFDGELLENYLYGSDEIYDLLVDTVRYLKTGQREFPLESRYLLVIDSSPTQPPGSGRTYAEVKGLLQTLKGIFGTDWLSVQEACINMWCVRSGGYRDLVMFCVILNCAMQRV